MNPRDLVQRMLDAIQRTDIESFVQLYAEDAVMHHPLSPVPLEGRAAIRESEQAIFDAFSDVEVEIVTLLTDERSAVIEVVLRATNTGPIEMGPGELLPATGRRIELPAAWFYEYDADGLVTAERDYFDTATLMAQLGVEG